MIQGSSWKNKGCNVTHAFSVVVSDIIWARSSTQATTVTRHLKKQPFKLAVNMTASFFSLSFFMWACSFSRVSGEEVIKLL